MSDSTTGTAGSSDSSPYGGRRVELSLVLEFADEQYLDADGEVNEDLMCREALDYAAEATRRDFDIEIALINEDRK